MYSLRVRRRLILVAYFAAVGLLTAIHAVFSLFGAFLLFPSFRHWLYRLFFGQTDCPTCGKTIPLVGSWRCGGCGFLQHRHAFRRCAKCGLGVGELPCPHCQHGVIL